MQRLTRSIPILLGLVALLALTATPALAARAEVTITNLTHAQIFSPPVVASHTKDFVLFEPGDEASDGLAMLAKDGVTSGLESELANEPQVFDIAVGSGMIMPGQSMTLVLEVNGHHRWISTASMLVTTNDAFTSARGVRTQRVPVMVYSDAWDAGAEENNEDCTYIPGPPCMNPGVNTTSSEGFIHVHPGIHGIASLMASDLDWRNPVAAVTVRLIDESAPLD